MLHTAHGYWITEAGPPAALPALDRELKADVVIVGGGFTGMWTAWHLSRTEPGLRIALLESDLMGHGPSGRNGGFADAMWVSFARLAERHGVEAAIEIGRASEESVTQIGEFCEEQGVDAWFRRAGYLNVSTAPAQDGAWLENTQAMSAAGVGEDFEILDAAALAGICVSPRFRGGVKYSAAATVQPARLAFGIRRAPSCAGAVETLR